MFELAGALFTGLGWSDVGEICVYGREGSGLGCVKAVRFGVLLFAVVTVGVAGKLSAMVAVVPGTCMGAAHPAGSTEVLHSPA